MSTQLDVPRLTPAPARRAPRKGRRAAAPHAHVVQFYEDETFLASAVADFLAEGLSLGEPLVVIATPEHLDGFARALAARGLDLARSRRTGRCTCLDARETLARFMVRGMPDAARFDRELGAVMERVATDGTPVRAFGEMVDLLWKDGNTEGAIRLEELWNGFAAHHRFSLLCAYSMGNFVGTAHAGHFQAICHAHTHVLPTERYTGADGDARLREIALLQQRARALESEVEHRRELDRRLRETLAGRMAAEKALRERERQLRSALAERERLLQSERAARAEAEAAREAAEDANRVKGEFLAVMSHELRTPLNAITGYSDLLELGVHGPLSPPQQEAVERIKRSGRHLLGLIDEVLTYTRVESGRTRYDIAEVPLDELLRAADALVLPQMLARGLRFAGGACSPSLAVRADAERARQILLNLLTNAAKFTPAGGSVEVSCQADGAAVRIQVRDTGVGIPPEKLEAVFEPFVQVDSGLTRAQEGVGLGLAISRELARAMGGDLVAESEEGRGSVFTLTLPLAGGD